MNPLPTRLATIAFFSTLLLLSCSGMHRNAPVPAKGDTVSAPGDSIWVIYQDSRNNYWFGSNGQGVYRYDGKVTIRFSVRDGLCNDSIRSIREDADGNLYFATRGGINRFDGQHFSTLVPVENGDWKLEPGDLWFPGRQELNGTYRYDGKQLYHLTLPKSDLHEAFYNGLPHPPFDPYEVYSTYRDSNGNMWLGTSSFGVCRYDGKGFKWISVAEGQNDPVRSITEDADGNFLFGNSSSGLYTYDGYRLTNLRKEKGLGNVKGMAADVPVSYNSIVKDDNGHFWIATHRSGVWQYDGKKSGPLSRTRGQPGCHTGLHLPRPGGNAVARDRKKRRIPFQRKDVRAVQSVMRPRIFSLSGFRTYSRRTIPSSSTSQYCIPSISPLQRISAAGNPFT